MTVTVTATVITAPEAFYPAMHQDKHTIYLAGAIDMGAAVDWQSEIVSSLHIFGGLCFLNPRRSQAFTPDMLDEQVIWELDAMEKADTILMWFPADSKAPVAMFESGLYWRSGKLVIGAEESFYRRRNLEITAQWYGVRLHPTLESVKMEVRSRGVFDKKTLGDG